MTRTIVYDATRAMNDPLHVSAADRVIANRLAADPSHRAWMVQIGARGIAPAPASQICVRLSDAQSLLAGRRRAAFEAARSWLLDPDLRAAAPPRYADARPRHLAAFSRARAPEPPQGAIFVKAGLHGWESPVLDRWLAHRPDLVIVAIVPNPWQLDFPEYATASDADAAARAWANVTRRAHAIIGPNEACAARASQAWIEPQPSELAGSASCRIDSALAAAPFMVLAAPIEARGNTLLMLQIWRELVQTGRPVPKLVLAGERGAQIDQIAPMLDWAESIRPHVFEVGRLNPDGLRRLLVHARGLLAPAFAAPDGALVRDADALGTRVLASRTLPCRDISNSGAEAIDPLDGPSWRDAILRAAERPPRLASDEAALVNWTEWSSAIFAFLATL